MDLVGIFNKLVSQDMVNVAMRIQQQFDFQLMARNEIF